MFELHTSMPPMRSAEYLATILLKFLIILHNYANVQTINQSKSLPGFRVVVMSLDGINSWLIQKLLRGENDLKQQDEIQATSLPCPLNQSFILTRCVKELKNSFKIRMCNSKLGCLLFSIGSSNIGTTLHGGDGEGKVIFPPFEVSKA